MKSLAKLIHDDRGVSAIEYCVLLALVGVTLIISLQSVGFSLAGNFSNTEAGLAASSGAGGGDGDGDGGDDGR